MPAVTKVRGIQQPVILCSSGGLIVPMVAAELKGRTLPDVLGSHQLTWIWADGPFS
jgi:hypothetical protein